MRKTLILLLLYSLTVSLFADDALIAAKGTLRVYLVGSYFFSDGWYRDNWGHRSGSASANVMNEDESPDLVGVNIGAAVEVGLTDWISVSINWIPGWTPWSDFVSYDDLTTFPTFLGYENADINGLKDLTVGASLILIGKNGPLLRSEKMRLTLTPGIVVPLPEGDYEEQFEKAWEEQIWHLDVEKHTFGISSALSFDYVFSKIFYINLLGGFVYHFEKTGRSVYNPFEDERIAYGVEIRFETEGHLEIPIEKRIRLGFGLPVIFTMSSPLKLDGETQEATDRYMLNIRPNLGLFLDDLPVPLEIELGYRLPLVGKNVWKQYGVCLQIVSDIKVF
jgi:hypothetical protein